MQQEIKSFWNDLFRTEITAEETDDLCKELGLWKLDTPTNPTGISPLSECADFFPSALSPKPEDSEEVGSSGYHTRSGATSGPLTTPNDAIEIFNFDPEEYSSVPAEKYLLPESQSVFKCPKTPNPKIEKAVPSNQCRNLYINYHNTKRYAESSSSDSLPDNPSKRVKTEVKTFTGISHLDEICIFEILKYLESEDLVNCMKIEMFSKIVEKYESSLLKQVYEYKYKLVDIQDLYNILRPDHTCNRDIPEVKFWNKYKCTMYMLFFKAM